MVMAFEHSIALSQGFCSTAMIAQAQKKKMVKFKKKTKACQVSNEKQESEQRVRTQP